MLSILGIDPGTRGALALHRPDKTLRSGLRWWVADIPDYSLMREWIRRWEPTAAYVEHTWHVGSSHGSYKLGYSTGWVRAMLEAFDVPIVTVMPAVWKGHFGLIKKDKKASLALARKLHEDDSLHHPYGRGMLARAQDHNRAEAVLIAKYGADVYGELI